MGCSWRCSVILKSCLDSSHGRLRSSAASLTASASTGETVVAIDASTDDGKPTGTLRQKNQLGDPGPVMVTEQKRHSGRRSTMVTGHAV